jgi:hypothetical protein
MGLLLFIFYIAICLFTLGARRKAFAFVGNGFASSYA